MPDPTTLDEFNKRASANMQITGYGAEVKTHFPCPGCAAAEWLEFPIAAAMNDYADVQEPSTCSECGRTFRLNIDRHEGSIDGMFVQLGGDPIPDYLPPMPYVKAD